MYMPSKNDIFMFVVTKDYANEKAQEIWGRDLTDEEIFNLTKTLDYCYEQFDEILFNAVDGLDIAPDYNISEDGSEYDLDDILDGNIQCDCGRPLGPFFYEDDSYNYECECGLMHTAIMSKIKMSVITPEKDDSYEAGTADNNIE